MDLIINNISIVKIYFRYGQQAKGQTFWHRLWNNNLGYLLLKKAREMNISQAAIFTAKAGYLQEDNITVNISEIPLNKNPACLELIDTVDKLQTYLADNTFLLADTNVILINNEGYQLIQSV